MRSALVLACLTLAAFPVAVAASPRSERRAVALYNRAVRAMTADKGCAPARPSPGKAIHGPPGDELLNAFGILRRPATEADQAGAEGRFPGFIEGGVFVDYIRAVTAADNRQYWVVPGRSRTPPLLPQHCVARLHHILRAEIRSEPRSVRRQAIRFYRSFAANNERAAHYHPYDTLYLFGRRANGGGGGGGGPLSFIEKYGMFLTSGRDAASSIASAIIPDGVVTIDFTFGRSYSRGPGRKPKRYPRVITSSAPVVDNVVSLEVPRSAEDAFPSKMIWRAADGHVVNVVDSLP